MNTEIVGTVTPQSSEYATIDKNRKILTWFHYAEMENKIFK